MATPTYIALATTTVTADASIILSSIPQGYRDLVLVVEGTNSAGASLLCRANNNVGSTSYPWVYMRGDGSSATSQSSASNDFVLGTVYSDRGVTIAQFLDYSASDKHKVCLSRNNTAAQRVQAFVSRWESTNAITQLEVKPSTGNFTGTISLYGIEA